MYGKYEEAKDILNRSIEIHSSNAEALSNLGISIENLMSMRKPLNNIKSNPNKTKLL